MNSCRSQNPQVHPKSGFSDGAFTLVPDSSLSREVICFWGARGVGGRTGPSVTPAGTHLHGKGGGGAFPPPPPPLSPGACTLEP